MATKTEHRLDEQFKDLRLDTQLMEIYRTIEQHIKPEHDQVFLVAEGVLFSGIGKSSASPDHVNEYRTVLTGNFAAHPETKPTLLMMREVHKTLEALRTLGFVTIKHLELS